VIAPECARSDAGGDEYDRVRQDEDAVPVNPVGEARRRAQVVALGEEEGLAQTATGGEMREGKWKRQERTCPEGSQGSAIAQRKREHPAGQTEEERGRGVHREGEGEAERQRHVASLEQQGEAEERDGVARDLDLRETGGEGEVVGRPGEERATGVGKSRHALEPPERRDQSGHASPREPFGVGREPGHGGEEGADRVIRRCVDVSQRRRLTHQLDQAQVRLHVAAAVEAVAQEQECVDDECGAGAPAEERGAAHRAMRSKCARWASSRRSGGRASTSAMASRAMFRPAGASRRET
jgi:hypothetical protein